MEKIAEQIADTDAGARTALRDLLKDVVLPGLGAGGLAPFLPLLLAHITSAMTHLTAAVRCALFSLFWQDLHIFIIRLRLTASAKGER